VAADVADLCAASSAAAPDSSHFFLICCPKLKTRRPARPARAGGAKHSNTLRRASTPRDPTLVQFSPQASAWACVARFCAAFCAGLAGK
jgi:hypothetical protein